MLYELVCVVRVLDFFMCMYVCVCYSVLVMYGSVCVCVVFVCVSVRVVSLNVL